MKTRAAYNTNHSIYILCEQTIRDKPFSNLKTAVVQNGKTPVLPATLNQKSLSLSQQLYSFQTLLLHK